MEFSRRQQEIIDARGSNILVSASAGSGKTTVLVERLCQLVLQDRIDINSILAMTFTEDAALEMKTRLKQRLEQEDTKDPFIARQLTLLERANISTIHGFCLSLLQEFYYLLNISYSMSQSVETGILNEQAMDMALQAAIEEVDAKEYASLKWYLKAFGQDEKDLRNLILKLLEMAKTKPDPDAWLESCLQIHPDTYNWFLDSFHLRVEALMDIFEQMENAMYEMEFKKAADQQHWITIFQNKQNALKACLEALEERKWNQFGNLFIEYLETTGKVNPTINKISFATLQKQSRELEKEIAQDLFDQKKLSELQQKTLPYQKTFIELARLSRSIFQEKKKEMEIIDFSDMEQFAFSLLSMPDVQKEIQNRFEYILVDEYQDTNDLQEAIISKAARKDNVFRVGDVKQSIYGFRQAKPSLMKSMMDPAYPDMKVMVMDENYRSNANIISFANEFFGQLMNVKGMDPQFSKLDVAKPGTLEQSDGPQKPIRFLYTEYQGWQDPEREKNNDVYAKSRHKRNRLDMIAHDIVKQIENGASYRDIAILSRASTQHQPLQEALEAYGIPVLSKSRKGFYANQAIQIVTSTLKALSDPRDDIALLAALCSPIGKAKQESVFKASMHRMPNESLYDALAGNPILDSFNQLLEHRFKPVGELTEIIYNFHDFYNKYTSSQDKTNLDLFLQKAAAAQSVLNLKEFIELVNREEDFNQTGEAMPFGKEADVVKLTTIHASKGLQYDIVYLLSETENRDMDAGNPIWLDPDLGVSFMALSDNGHIKWRTPSHMAFDWKRFAEDLNEKMRLFYVAATRAKKELVLVDTLKSASEFKEPLSRAALWSNKGFTSWFFHVYQNHPSSLVEFDVREGIYKRPKDNQKSNQYYTPKKYDKPVLSLSSKTASAAKENRKWRKFAITSSANMDRGTLFHEMAQKLPYPYKEEDLKAYASRHDYEMKATDIKQMLALNENEQYAKLMEMNPVFECAYNVMEDGSLFHGYMDMLCQQGNEIHILDFKTDTVFDMDQLITRYRPQLETYKKAMKTIHPDKEIHAWIYSFHLNDIGLC